MRAVLLLLVVGLLAGCGAPAPAPEANPGPNLEGMRIAGLVEADTLIPLAGANVTLVGANLTVVSAADGTFAFPPQPERPYLVEATLAGYLPQQILAQPGTSADRLDFVLQPSTPLRPFQQQIQFRGAIDCAVAAGADGTSCDSNVPGGSGALVDHSRFQAEFPRAWQTVVIDLVFDPESVPGLDGLTLHLGNMDAADEAGFGMHTGNRSFTVRLDPGVVPLGGTLAPDSNMTGLTLDVTARGKAACAACPPAGAATNVQFDLLLTIFYVEAAPEGFTLRTDT